MIEHNKAVLEKGNRAITNSDNEGFLSLCTEDIKWVFVGDQTLEGKDAVRQYMAKTYVTPPEFVVEHLIAEGDFVTAIGSINLKDESGTSVHYKYCDVWRFRDGKMAELRAFVIKV